MSLPIDAAPPGHLPRAATPPWPIQPPPHGATAPAIPVRPAAPHDATGWVRAALAAAAAAAIGLAVATPLLLARRAKSGASHRSRRRAKA